MKFLGLFGLCSINFRDDSCFGSLAPVPDKYPKFLKNSFQVYLGMG